MDFFVWIGGIDIKALIEIEYNNTFIFSGSVLNKIYDIQYNGNEYKLYTPVYVEKSNNLDYPKEFLNMKELKDSAGSCYSIINNKCESCLINKVFLEFDAINKEEINKRVELINDIGNSLLNRITKKIYIYSNAYKLEGFINRKTIIKKVISYGNREYHRVRIPNKDPIVISIYGKSSYITNKVITKVLNSLETSISIPYDFYVAGVKDYEKSNFRYCVLDCATGVELSITNELINILKEKGLLKIEEFLKDYQGIKRKKDLLSHLVKYDLSGLNFSKVSNPRNKAIHMGSSIDEKTAEECLVNSKKIIDFFELKQKND